MKTETIQFDTTSALAFEGNDHLEVRKWLKRENKPNDFYVISTSDSRYGQECTSLQEVEQALKQDAFLWEDHHKDKWVISVIKSGCEVPSGLGSCVSFLVVFHSYGQLNKMCTYYAYVEKLDQGKMPWCFLDAECTQDIGFPLHFKWRYDFFAPTFKERLYMVFIHKWKFKVKQMVRKGLSRISDIFSISSKILQQWSKSF